jgi:hypothetical protein
VNEGKHWQVCGGLILSTASGSTPLNAQKQHKQYKHLHQTNKGEQMAIKGNLLSMGDLWMEVERYSNATQDACIKAKLLLQKCNAFDVIEMLGL